MQVYFGITIVFSLIGWACLARVVRGRSLAWREEDFIMAAQPCGASEACITFRSLLSRYTAPNRSRTWRYMSAQWSPKLALPRQTEVGTPFSSFSISL